MGPTFGHLEAQGRAGKPELWRSGPNFGMSLVLKGTLAFHDSGRGLAGEGVPIRRFGELRGVLGNLELPPSLLTAVP